MRIPAALCLLALVPFIIIGCSKPEILPDEQPKIISGLTFDPDYDFNDHVSFQKPGSLPAGGTKGKYVAVRSPGDKYPPVNPWRNTNEVPEKKSPYEYRNSEHEQGAEAYTTDISSPDVYKESDEPKTLQSDKRAEEAREK